MGAAAFQASADKNRATPPLTLKAQARGEVIAAGLRVTLEHVDGVALVGELDAHAARELVAGDHGMNEIALRRPAHAAAPGIPPLVPSAFDLAVLDGDFQRGVDLVVVALAIERLGHVA